MTEHSEAETEGTEAPAAAMPVLIGGEFIDWIRDNVGLSTTELAELVNKSVPTVKRWRSQGSDAEIPPDQVSALDDVYALAGRMRDAGFAKKTVRGFLRSRNSGLGNDRPLLGLSVKYKAFWRVEYVTDCYIRGVAPKPGHRLGLANGSHLETAGDAVPAAAPGGTPALSGHT